MSPRSHSLSEGDTHAVGAGSPQACAGDRRRFPYEGLALAEKVIEWRPRPPWGQARRMKMG